MRVIVALFSYGLNFLFSFFLAGIVPMPHLPPYPRRPVTPFEIDFWIRNWAGAVLGVLTVGAEILRVRRIRRD